MLPVSRQVSRVRCFCSCVCQTSCGPQLCATTTLCSASWIKSTSAAVTSGYFSRRARQRKAHFLVLRRVFVNAPSTDARPNMAKGSRRDTSLTSYTVGNLAPVIRRAVRWRVMIIVVVLVRLAADNFRRGHYKEHYEELVCWIQCHLFKKSRLCMFNLENKIHKINRWKCLFSYTEPV